MITRSSNTIRYLQNLQTDAFTVGDTHSFASFALADFICSEVNGREWSVDNQFKYLFASFGQTVATQIPSNWRFFVATNSTEKQKKKQASRWEKGH